MTCELNDASEHHARAGSLGTGLRRAPRVALHTLEEGHQFTFMDAPSATG